MSPRASRRVLAALPVVGDPSNLSRANILGTVVSVDRHAVAICNGGVLALLGGGNSCGPAVDPAGREGPENVLRSEAGGCITKHS
jgi:hypothetical protein